MPHTVEEGSTFERQEVDLVGVGYGGDADRPGKAYVVPTSQKDSMIKVIQERGYQE